jgi:hypothetical protein
VILLCHGRRPSVCSERKLFVRDLICETICCTVDGRSPPVIVLPLDSTIIATVAYLLVYGIGFPPHKIRVLK